MKGLTLRTKSIVQDFPLANQNLVKLQADNLAKESSDWVMYLDLTRLKFDRALERI